MARIGDPFDLKYFGKNGGHLGGNGSDEENLSFSGPRWQRYHQTKLANFTFTYELKNRLEQANINNVITLVAHPGLALTELAATTVKTGGMDANSEFMGNAQSAEDSATGIIRTAMDPNAKSGEFFEPELWAGFPDSRPPEEDLISEHNLKVAWQGCEEAVGTFSL